MALTEHKGKYMVGSRKSTGKAPNTEMGQFHENLSFSLTKERRKRNNVSSPYECKDMVPEYL